MANTLQSRLRALVAEAGGQAAFCRRVWKRERDPAGANKAKVSKWLNGSGMRPAEVENVARAFGRRPAWLLWGELPEREGVTRTQAALGVDVAVHVAGEVRRLIQDDPALPADWRRRIERHHFDGAEILRRAVEREAERVREAYAEADRFAKHVENVRHAARVRSLELRVGRLADQNVELQQQLRAKRKTASPTKRRKKS